MSTIQKMIDAHRRMSAFWQMALEHDGLPSGAQQAQFSKDNPLVPLHTKAAQEFQLYKRMITSPEGENQPPFFVL